MSYNESLNRRRHEHRQRCPTDRSTARPHRINYCHPYAPIKTASVFRTPAAPCTYLGRDPSTVQASHIQPTMAGPQCRPDTTDHTPQPVGPARFGCSLPGGSYQAPTRQVWGAPNSNPRKVPPTVQVEPRPTVGISQHRPGSTDLPRAPRASPKSSSRGNCHRNSSITGFLHTVTPQGRNTSQSQPPDGPRKRKRGPGEDAVEETQRMLEVKPPERKRRLQAPDVKVPAEPPKNYKHVVTQGRKAYLPDWAVVQIKSMPAVMDLAVLMGYLPEQL